MPVVLPQLCAKIEEVKHGTELSCTLLTSQFLPLERAVDEIIEICKFHVELEGIAQALTWVADLTMSILTGCPALFRLAVVFFQYRRAVVKQALGSPYLPPIAWAIVRMKAFGVSKLSRLAPGLRFA
jgi:hypothetical protein